TGVPFAPDPGRRCCSLPTSFATIVRSPLSRGIGPPLPSPRRRGPMSRPPMSLHRWFVPVAAFAWGIAAAHPAAGITLKVQPDSALAHGPPYYATLVAANAAAVAGDSVEVTNAGSPYAQTAPLNLVSGVVYRGGFGPRFEGPNVVLYETVLSCH